TELRALVDRLEALGERRLASRPRTEPAKARATRFADHLAGHVRVRAASLDAPLLVVLVGPTGAGKSTVFNTIAGRAASETGVLRPTTRIAVVLVHPDDRPTLADGTLARIAPSQIRFVEDASVEPGLVLVDAPDIDSVEHANRELTDRLVEAADLALFVTTATRYADRVPWAVLDRVRERGLPLQVIVNRMPPDAADQADILTDVRRLLAEAGLEAVQAGSEDGPPREIISVPEGALDPTGDRLRRDAIAPVLDEIARLRADREARLELAARALTGSLTGLGESIEALADDAEHESIDVEALRRIADRSYENSLDALRHEVGRGTFLREEALRQWQTFVGADQMTRFFSQGIGRIRGVIAAAIRPATAPVAEVRAATTEDLVAVARLQAAEAARRTATSWSETTTAGRSVAEQPELWVPSPDFEIRLQERLERWIEGITEEIQSHGRPKRLLARGAAVGVNAMGTGVMLATFVHTGGITGAELGVAAATAFLNQKVLAALFGEAAMAELVAHARQRLDEALSTTFDEERARFDGLLPATGELTTLATDLRAAAAEVRALPAPG
ncbi:MAG TPA: GTPase, partial [Candidatus Limnocylindrales bacterium]|nr:GTPase [Candidatus Limnocylindrales bacterium]